MLSGIVCFMCIGYLAAGMLPDIVCFMFIGYLAAGMFPESNVLSTSDPFGLYILPYLRNNPERI